MRSMTRSACAFTKCRRLLTGYAPQFSLRTSSTEAPVAADAIRCDACPVLCYIKPGRTGSCDRYGNHEGKLVRLDPHIVLDRAVGRGEQVVPFMERAREWDGNLVNHGETFITAIGA